MTNTNHHIIKNHTFANYQLSTVHYPLRIMLFQKSVQKKYIADLDKTKLDTAFQKLIAHFGNPSVQDNIRKAKEEQYQEGFLRELFVDVFGYTLNPQPDFNLTTELKNETNSKKVDGAILKDQKAVAVIELKSLKTTDLQAIELQAFNYKNNQSDCVYVVTSNFQKLRFYIENAVAFEEFDLFDLSRERFALLYLCLSADSILSDLPLRIKKASLEKEEDITRKFYADYSLFKKTLFHDIAERNKDVDRLLVFKKTQKLLDRFLFVFFAEDKGLLPPNSITEILTQWDKLNDLDAYTPLYSRFQKYFGYLNTGYKGKTYDIFAYNGGLFAPDAVLDGFLISDNILYNHTRALSHYDFDTDVDTNILGHIFEHSLNEMDEIAAYTEGALLDKTKTKRKKDGIFYTPRYITKYMVENTVGALCRRKQAELGLNPSDMERETDKKKRNITHAKITAYRTWLLDISILDPACGSGAFLNQALEFLIEEHRLIDTMTATLFGDSFLLTDNVTEILENNIFGVDINEESVEIARLSLWLRTAKVGRKLNDLSRNIKCGNSLIEAPSVAGDKAFVWQTEFKHIFDKGGFDVVIGNPPYVFARDNFSDLEKSYYTNNYVSIQYQINTYVVFIEKSIKLLKENGLSGLIVPNSWLMIGSTQKLRTFLLENTAIDEIVNLSGNSFSDANVETIILVTTKTANATKPMLVKQNQNENFILLHEKNQNSFSQSEGCEFKIFADEASLDITTKLLENSEELDTIATVKSGLKAYEAGKGNPKQTSEDVKQRPYDFTSKIDDNTYPYLEGKDVSRYFINWSGSYLKYGEHLAAPRTFNIFNSPKIIIREITGIYPKSIIATYSSDVQLFNMSNIVVLQRDENYDLKYILCVLNSTLMSYYFVKNTPKSVRQMFPKIILVDLRKFPIKKASIEEQQPFITLADKMLTLTAKLQTQQTKFLKLLQSTYPTLESNRKMTQWYELSFGEFRKELTRQKAVIPVKELLDWQDLFETQCAVVKSVQTEIAATDKAIDGLVYGLYGLTAAEIGVVEQ